MKLFLYLFYTAVKNLVLFCFRIFYRETVILHRERLKPDGATIIVSNHPSTLTDPLNVAARVDTMVHFLANASLFKHWFGNWFFNTFYCIPIERPKDVGGRKISNANSFAKCDAFLSGGGCLYIAPEGVSNMERRLQELKTGTARIALSAESKNDFQLGLKILPVGLSYSAQTDFRTDVLVNPGTAFAIAPYREAYARDPIATVRQLTADLEERLKDLIIHTTDDEEDQLLRDLEKLQQAARPLAYEAHFFRTQKTLTKLQKIRREQAGDYLQIKENLSALLEKVKQKKTNQKALFATGQEKLQQIQMRRGMALVTGFPFFIYGWVNNFLANYFPALLARKLQLYVGYDSTIKLMSSLILYPLFYGIQCYLVQYFFGQWWITLLYLLSLYPLGIFAWRYRLRYRDWQKGRQMRQWQKSQPEEVKKELERQQSILRNFS